MPPAAGPTPPRGAPAGKRGPRPHPSPDARHHSRHPQPLPPPGRLTFPPLFSLVWARILVKCLLNKSVKSISQREEAQPRVSPPRGRVSVKGINLGRGSPKRVLTPFGWGRKRVNPGEGGQPRGPGPPSPAQRRQGYQPPRAGGNPPEPLGNVANTARARQIKMLRPPGSGEPQTVTPGTRRGWSQPPPSTQTLRPAITGRGPTPGHRPAPGVGRLTFSTTFFHWFGLGFWLTAC